MRSWARSVRRDAAIGIKPVSEFGTKRLVRQAIQYAIDRGRESVTLVHKGNIMKFTEGAFKNWGYEVAAEEFADETITEDELWSRYDGKIPAGKVVDQGPDRRQHAAADADPHRRLRRGGHAQPQRRLHERRCRRPGRRPGHGAGRQHRRRPCVFEATHGTAPKYAGQDMVNPGSLILSGSMMLEYMGWDEAAELVVEAMTKTIEQKRVTYDLHRQMEGATKLSTSEFASAIIENM
jgi:isocitrate dehydrogenase